MNNFNWSFDPSCCHDDHTDILAEGDYRVSISNAMPTVAKNGTEGVEITFDVNGHSNRLRHYIWFNHNDVQRTNQKLGQFFNSFDIGPMEYNSCTPWVDKKGAVHVVHAEYKGRTIAKVAFCIERDKQDTLPPWQEEASVNETKSSFAAPKVTPAQFTSWEAFGF